ncbi:MAG: 50S ribosomal protein L22 [Deltaproteobacteria bacterium]|nr:50S ribosomal protein L22 [Deltaproteobacteria bacterium]
MDDTQQNEDQQAAADVGDVQIDGTAPLAAVKLKGLHIAPRKVRVVADRIRGKGVQEALDLLQFTPKLAAEPLRKLLFSAVANARFVGGVDVDDLYVETIFVDQAETMKRWTPRAQGRATRILKKTSHVTLQLGVAL